jgi:hypothetical protein
MNHVPERIGIIGGSGICDINKGTIFDVMHLA